MKARHIALEIGDDLGPGHEAVGVIAPIIRTRELRLPVGRVEGEGIPAMVAPGIPRRVRLLEDDMVPALPAQMVAERKPGLAATDDDGIHVIDHDCSPNRPGPGRYRRGGPFLSSISFHG